MKNKAFVGTVKRDFPESKIISVNGINLEIFEAGEQNVGNPIVLCHGFPEHAYSWRYQIPALVEAGYHVLVPNQRGYGKSSCPTDVKEYDIKHLTDDMLGMLHHFGYQSATFIGHDWGANVVWCMAQLFPESVDKIINLALPYQVRGEKPWIEWMEEVFGEDFYFVHFNRKVGVADKVMHENTSQFLNNIFRKNISPEIPEPGMLMINLAKAKLGKGEALMSDEDLEVYISSFTKTGFTGAINWYRNLDRNWHLLQNVNPIIKQSTLMIYGEKDTIPPFENLRDFVPNLDVLSLNAGHCIQQELPEETNSAILNWLKENSTN